MSSFPRIIAASDKIVQAPDAVIAGTSVARVEMFAADLIGNYVLPIDPRFHRHQCTIDNAGPGPSGTR